MGATKVARKLGSARKSAAKLAVMGAAVATAATVAVGSAPPASALVVDQQVYTAGPLLNLLPLLGVDTIPISLGTLPGIGDTTLILDLAPIEYDTPNIYNTVNALPFSQRSGLGNPPYDRVFGAPVDPPSQFPAVLGSGIGTLNTIKAYRAQISSVGGSTPPGYTPYQPVPGSSGTITNQALLYLRNPLRPNGGIGPRFGPLLSLFGLDSSLPDVGQIDGAAGTGMGLNTATLDVTWAYDLFSDFPVTLNPFSLVNSLLAVLPVNLAGGVSLQALNLVDAGVNIAGTLGILRRIAFLPISEGAAWYGTLLPNDLPILEPLRFPSRLINAVTGLNLGTPLADALQPAAKILVNIGYSDVVTPAEIAADPTLAETYQPYDRTFLTSATTEPFLSVNPLTPAEWLQVPGDVVKALVGGFVSVFAPGLAGGAASQPATTAAVRAAATTARAITAPEALPTRSRGANVRAPQSVGGARAASQVRAAAASKRPAAARSAAHAAD
jgi:hypothetical protein